MNRFRTKKKVKDEPISSRPSQDSEAGFRPFRKAKKSHEAEKVELDLTTALPSSDDFRTSLLMTGLSARFSMLREQDDPNTKIGKASDDSVLYGNRQSRIMDYGGFRGLSDIAEVESIKTATRPFARTDSFNSSDDGSVMTRAKPIEGNNLFGGRQKIYKVPVGASGGMAGRALYDDDVALSAFQKWRQAERERKSSEDEREESFEWRPEESGRSESPYGYNRKRETSSTTSSVPSMARNSTAATSIASTQPPTAAKEWQTGSTAPASASSTPGLDRSVTRTRRLYENGLTNDLHEQQTSALSRMDTLTRQRGLGSRTPDLAQNSPSPTSAGFVDRLADRRILGKASAPNLRSVSPPMTASPSGTPDLSMRIPPNSELRTTFGAISPPLSPPISETEEHPVLPIQPNDHGKATALGVFQKPSQPYDESKYAQRQLQLQQGRETQEQRDRTGSIASAATGRSGSSASGRAQGVASRSEAPFIDLHLPSTEESRPTTFFDDSEGVPLPSSRPALPSMPLTIRRPSDSQHPAFRESALPTPLSFSAKGFEESSPNSERPPTSGSKGQEAEPVDSPTLGPALPGLKGLVRQHLRNDSSASSIYGALPPTAGLISRFPVDSWDARSLSEMGAEANPYGLEESANRESSTLPVEDNLLPPVAPAPDAAQAEKDEFASQLADGARRIRERLTTYVESDSRSTSPHAPLDRVSREIAANEPVPTSTPAKTSALSMLRSKSSRSSMADRGREPTQAMPKRIGAMGSPAPSPNPNNDGFEERRPIQSSREQSTERRRDVSVSKEPMEPEIKEEENGEVHAGLRAFRQARRELQKLKEMETQARHQQQQPSVDSQPSATSERGMRQRTPSQDRKPPPIYYQTRASGEETRRLHSDSRSPSRSERDRSGSDSSRGGRSRSRPGRLRNGSVPTEQLSPNGANGPARSPMLRSPGLPGTDIRHSPHMPPAPYPGSSSAANNQAAQGSGNTLQVSYPRGYESSQPSPISPIPSPMMHSAPTTPGLQPSPRRPSAPQIPGFDFQPSMLHDQTRRPVKKQDISEPTLVSSTSRVPTRDLPPEAERNRSRSRSSSNSRGESGPYAPPLPPINPRRRQDGPRANGAFGAQVDGAFSSTPNLTLANIREGLTKVDDGRISSPVDEETSRPMRRKLIQMHSEPNGINLQQPRNNAPPINIGPPASRMVVTQNMKPSGSKLPGGMI